MASSSTSVTSFEMEPVEYIRARGNPSGSRYPFPSYVNSASFVSIKLLSKANYGRWQEQMNCLLQCHGMIGFINGKLKGPVDDGEASEEWKRSDTLVKGWIFGSLSEDAMDTVVGLQTANDVWEKLKTTYSTPAACMTPTTSSPTTIQKDTAEYLPLFRAIMKNDWETAKEIFDEDNNALTAKVAINGNSALHLAIYKEENIQFFENLLKEIDSESLPILVSNDKFNPLHRAANYDNKIAAEMLVNKNPKLLFLSDVKYLPIERAIVNSHRTTFQYLLKACENNIELCQEDGYQNPFEGIKGAIILTSAIASGFLDVSYELIGNYPDMARTKSESMFPLSSIARKWDAYYSGTRYDYYQTLVYSFIPTDINHLYDTTKIQDVENQKTNDAKLITKCTKNRIYSVIQRIYIKIWKVALLRVAHIKHLHEEKVKHREALLVLKRICEEVGKLKKECDIQAHYKEAIEFAVYNDTFEVIEEIIKYFPHALWALTDGDNLTQVAIRNRCEKTYNFLVRYLSCDKYGHQQAGLDKDHNNLLHLAVELAPIHKLNLVSGAALQMQRELQWFREVQNFVKPKYKEGKNKKRETPIMVFRREHMQLRKEGEEWMKKTADSYTITAALIITIVFAAAITVPGGNNGNSGKAIYATKQSFIVFAVSDAISLFTSTTSLLLFLSILTTRFRDEDFLYRLPKRLILGLAMLFLSVTSMMVAFSATLYLLFGQGKAWILILITALTCLPIASFVTLQLPLLVDMISSTYGRGIFVKKRDHKVKQL